jgi:DNA-binding MarR family transcriptional regulator
MLTTMRTLSAPDAELASTLRMSVMRLARRLRAQRSDLSLTLTQLAALATLERHGPLTPGELAEHEKVQPPSMTRVLGILEDHGLVQREPHPTDGRQQVVTITRQAVTMLREDRRRKDAWLAKQLTELTADERAALRAAAPVLERLARS